MTKRRMKEEILQILDERVDFCKEFRDAAMLALDKCLASEYCAEHYMYWCGCLSEAQAIRSFIQGFLG